MSVQSCVFGDVICIIVACIVEAKTITNDVKRKMIAKAPGNLRFWGKLVCQNYHFCWRNFNDAKKTVVVWIYNTIIQSYYLYFYFIIIISLILFFGLLGLWNHPIDTKRILNPQNRWNFSCLRKPMPKAWRRTNRMWGLRIVTASHITQTIHSRNWSHWFDYSFSSKKLK